MSGHSKYIFCGELKKTVYMDHRIILGSRSFWSTLLGFPGVSSLDWVPRTPENYRVHLGTLFYSMKTRRTSEYQFRLRSTKSLALSPASSATMMATWGNLTPVLSSIMREYAVAWMK